MFSAFFADGPVTNYDEAAKQDTAAFARFFHAMLTRGINLAPSAYEAWFVSMAHTDADLERTAAAIDVSMREAARA